MVEKTLATNYHGTVYATEAFLPLLRPSATSRLVNVASQAGSLAKFAPALQERFRAASSASSPAPSTALMREFESTVRNGMKHSELGYPSSAYVVSKAGLIAATRAVALAVPSTSRYKTQRDAVRIPSPLSFLLHHRT